VHALAGQAEHHPASIAMMPLARRTPTASCQWMMPMAARKSTAIQAIGRRKSGT